MKLNKIHFIYIIILFILLWIYLFKYNTENLTNICIRVDNNKLNNFKISNNNTSTNIYYINVDKSIDRNARFLSRLYPIINPIRISAITPNTLPKILKSNLCESNTNTEFACTLSHLKAIYTAYTNKEKYAIIMEDDAIMLRNFDWDKLVNLAPNNWEILQLHTTCIPGTTFFYHPVYKYRHNNNLWIKKDHFIASCACYIVSKEGMEKLISRYLKDINNFTIDNYFNKYNTIDWKHIKTQCQADSLVYFQLNKYICTQILIDVENLDSDIRDMNHEWSTCHRHSKNFIKYNLH